MTVHQLSRPTALPAGLLRGSVAGARAAVEAAAGVALSSAETWELGEALTELSRLEAQAAALRLALLAEADAREVAEQSAATGTDAWAARLTGSTRAVMAGGLWLARLLTERYAATRGAFAAGRISEDQARVIVRAAEKMPEAATAEQRIAAEEDLVARAATGVDPRRLRQAARRMLERVSKDLADEQESDMLEDEEESAEVETWLTLYDNGDGTVSGRFVIPELHGQLLRTALERLTAPRRLSTNNAGEPVTDQTLIGQAQSLSWSERLGLGFTELLEHLPADGHGPLGMGVMVHIDFVHLLNGLGAARLDNGTRISAATARRLACGAGIIPAVLGGRSEVLDLGRAKRLHTPAQRRALSVRHDTCAAEGCERPFAWCEVHHPHSWKDGGGTDLANAVPLCGHHHRRAHDDRYRVRHLPTGEVRFRRRSPAQERMPA